MFDFFLHLLWSVTGNAMAIGNEPRYRLWFNIKRISQLEFFFGFGSFYNETVPALMSRQRHDHFKSQTVLPGLYVRIRSIGHCPMKDIIVKERREIYERSPNRFVRLKDNLCSIVISYTINGVRKWLFRVSHFLLYLR